MLVLSRKVGQRIWIGDEISVTVVRISGGAVRLGIEAPPQMPVTREELRAGSEPDEDAADDAVPTAAAD
jgi:carbon storage regulator